MTQSNRNFEVDISKFVAKAGGRVDLVIRKISLDMFTRVVLRSPVDTGRFRGNWQVAIGSIPAGTLELDDKTGSAVISKTNAAAEGIRAGDVVYFVNNLPYAEALERGHSKQAPAGMVTLTVSEFANFLRKATEGMK